MATKIENLFNHLTGPDEQLAVTYDARNIVVTVGGSIMAVILGLAFMASPEVRFALASSFVTESMLNLGAWVILSNRISDLHSLRGEQH